MRKSGSILIYLLTIPLTFFLLGAFLVNNTGLATSLKDLFAPLLTLLAAFGGAYFAHLFNIRRMEESKNKELLKAANMILLNYSNALNILLNYKKQILRPVLESPLRHLALRPSAKYSNVIEHINLDSLHDLFDKQEVLNLISEIQCDIEGYKGLTYLINQRSDFHREHYQPVNQELYEVRTEQEAIERLGHHIWFTLLSTTNSIIDLTDVMIASLKKNGDTLHATMKEFVSEPKKLVKIGTVDNEE